MLGQVLGILLATVVIIYVAASWVRDKSTKKAETCPQQEVVQGERRTERPASRDDSLPKPISVNYHFTRRCNYRCGFCFHTAKTSFVLPIEEAKRGLKLLKDAGMEKINFSGGEPFLEKGGRYVGELTRYCKQDLGLPSVSIVSNGSLVKEKWFEDYGEYLDILAISCDSFDFETNDLIGRKQGQKDHVASLLKVHDWCNQYKVAFKINTVVNTYNKHEDMTEQIQQLQPVRWKIFQCLLMEGENAGPDALRNAEGFLVTDQEFEDFLTRHKEVACLVPESNKTMQNSYLILDEYMRFLDCRGGGKTPSRSLLDVGVDSALAKSGFDEKMFYKRGGKYVWSKADMKLDW
ncbi:radical S-adenosyl methionine domain-containing protein 2 [Lingula anatina]|uniref:S-adenosylmethionine-dependent nucleotide dehydratase RSAD2 n=1 Tax=Lingula anatina TaxID=7574 RepID=A0A1S3IKH7_LINAN|nr:radical S-adenosyl methionine domain-containing protein 2 [Lingula anatina]|eukprot:XP_013398024.1 radical S-adenosyl methionine domain-containing protein 2 [Lingula anatina]